MTVTIGTWIVPLAITIISIVVANYASPEARGDYGGIGSGFVGVIYLAGALILSLISWLIWALAR